MKTRTKRAQRVNASWGDSTPLTKQDARNATYSIGSQGVGAILAFFALRYITHHSQPEAFGFYAYAAAIIALITGIINFGFNKAHTLIITQHNNRNLTNYAVILTLGAGLIVILASAFYLYWYHNPNVVTDTNQTVLLIALVTGLLAYLTQLPKETWVADLSVGKMAITHITSNAARLIIIPILLSNYQDLTITQQAIRIALGYFSGTLAGTLLIIPLWYWKAPEYQWQKPEAHIIRKYYHYTKTLGIIIIAGVILNNLDQAMLGYISNTTQVAYYSAALRLVTMALLPTLALASYLYARLCRTHKETATQYKLYRRSQAIFIALTIPGTLILLLIPYKLLAITLGVQYEVAGQILQLLALWGLLQATLTPSMNYLIAKQQTKRAAAVSVILLVTNLILNIVLIPQYAAIGAAYATIIATMCAIISAEIIIYRIRRL